VRRPCAGVRGPFGRRLADVGRRLAAVAASAAAAVTAAASAVARVDQRLLVVVEGMSLVVSRSVSESSNAPGRARVCRRRSGDSLAYAAGRRAAALSASLSCVRAHAGRPGSCGAAERNPAGQPRDATVRCGHGAPEAA